MNVKNYYSLAILASRVKISYDITMIQSPSREQLIHLWIVWHGLDLCKKNES